VSIVRALITADTLSAEARPRGRASVDPRQPIAEPLVSFRAPDSYEAEQYRALRHLVERLRRDEGLQMFAVTSPAASEGKTVTTLNLAGSLAQSADARVLVIDADLHRPAVANYMGYGRQRSTGLADSILYEDHPLSRTVRHIEALNISVLLAGTASAGPYELLTSPRLEAVLADARRQYDYVLIDTPPVVPLADSRLLTRLVDGYIVVVAAHKTTKKLVADAFDLLDSARLIAVVFNGDDRPLSPYYGYYGYASRPAPRSR
jgi:capsular exopolysaccharide synthesis family protein